MWPPSYEPALRGVAPNWPRWLTRAGPGTSPKPSNSPNEFAFDKDEITNDSKPVLDVAVERLGQCPEVRVTIAGHTDSIGTEEYNLGLSERRAMSTKGYFVKSGVDPSRLDTRGYGLNEPIAPNDTSEGRAQNRRVELGASK